MFPKFQLLILVVCLVIVVFASIYNLLPIEYVTKVEQVEVRVAPLQNQESVGETTTTEISTTTAAEIVTSTEGTTTTTTQEPTTTTSEQPKTNVKIFNIWNECIKKKIEGVIDHKTFWNSFEPWTVECDTTADINRLGLIDLQNRDEMKYGILPLKTDNSTSDILLTLGIGKDIDAEIQFRDKMLAIGRNMTFYGVDPITDVNEKLYQTIGKYFPFAVGGDAGFMSAMVLVGGSYTLQNIAHIDLIYFLNRVLKIKTFDHLWFDAEYSEYSVLDMFYKDGRFEQNDIKFCQMSLEIHNPNEDQQKAFMAFIKRLVEEKRYGFFRNKNVSHMRMFLFNFGEPYCVQKFIDLTLQ